MKIHCFDFADINLYCFRQEEAEKREKRRQEEEAAKQKREELKRQKEEATARRLAEQEERRKKKLQEEEEKREQKRQQAEAKKKQMEDKQRAAEEKKREVEEKKRQEEEKKRKQEEERERQIRRQSNLLMSFIKKEEKSKPKFLKAVCDHWLFQDFEIKEGMTLAPIHVRQTKLTDEEKENLLKIEVESEYLKNLPKRNVTKCCPNKAKYYHFHENYRPPYYGTWRKKSEVVTGRRPFVKEIVS